MKDVWVHSSDWDNGYCVGKIEGAKDGYNLALEDTLETLKVWEDSKEKFIEYLELKNEVPKKITE